MLSCHESGTSAEAFRCMKAVLLVATQAESGSLRSDSAATAHIAKLELTAARLMLVVWDRELQITGCRVHQPGMQKRLCRTSAALCRCGKKSTDINRRRVRNDERRGFFVISFNVMWCASHITGRELSERKQEPVLCEYLELQT